MPIFMGRNPGGDHLCQMVPNLAQVGTKIEILNISMKLKMWDAITYLILKMYFVHKKIHFFLL